MKTARLVIRAGNLVILSGYELCVAAQVGHLTPKYVVRSIRIYLQKIKSKSVHIYLRSDLPPLGCKHAKIIYQLIWGCDP